MGLFGPTGGGGGAVTSVNSQTGVVNLTAQDVTATPLYYTYKQHSATLTGDPSTWTMPVANVAGFYNDIRLQGTFSSSTTIEIRIPRITPNESLVFGYECLFCCELADKLALGQQFPPIVVRDNGDNSVIFSRPGSANPNISFSLYLRKEFATGWEVIPFPADVQGKQDKNVSNGYAGLNSSGKIALEQLDATTTGEASATLPNPQIVLGSDIRLKPFACFRPSNWSRGPSGSTALSVPTSANFAVGDIVIVTGSTRTTGTGATIDGTHVVSSTSGTPVNLIQFQQPGETTATGTSGLALRRGIVGSAILKADWNAAAGQPDEILNKPTIPAAQVNANWDATSGVAQILNRPGNGDSFNISTWSGNGTTTTINATGHTFLVGQPVTFLNTGSTLLDGLSDVLVLSASTNSFTIASTLNGSGFGGFVARRGLITPVQMNQLQTAQQAARSVSISSWTANGTTATISATNHQYSTNDSILITGAGAIDGTYTITATTADQFTFATSVNATGTGGVAVRAGRMSNADKVTLDGIRRNAYGPMVILRFANWLRGSTGYGPGNPPTGMTTLTPKSGNVVENFNPDIYNPRLFNAGEFFGVGRQYKLICAVRCTEISFDGVHCQLRYFNGTTSEIIPGLMDFGGGNDGIAEKSYWATSATLTAVNEWWTFVPYFGAYNNNNGARIQDCVVIAHLV